MITLDEVAEVARGDLYLAIVSTLRADHTIQSTLVNAGFMAHPESGETVVAFVTHGDVKMRNLRARPQITVSFRAGWQWATVEGNGEIIGPDDPRPGFDADRLRLLLREIFVSAGGSHDDWDEYDRVMLADNRSAVFVVPTRVYSN